MTDASRRFFRTVFLLAVALVRPSLADVKLVTVDVPQDQVWAGQKATFFVNLRGKGPFVGAASFSLPQIPRTLIFHVGNPVVSSEDIEDDSWFVQTHEFALFSQVDGNVEVPNFEVRFSNRDGFTGPVQEHAEQVPALQLRVKRPTGSNPAAFLVTSDSLSVEERWEPTPGAANPGDVFHRTITQRADQVSGMALAPPPTSVPDGVRVHVDDPEIEDKTERGDFTGTRIDRITYVVEKPGTLTLPAVQYVWWKPKTEQFGSQTLPTVTFQVAAILPETSGDAASNNRGRGMLPLIAVLGLAAVGLAALVHWQRQRIGNFLSRLWKTLHPPERHFQRKLLRACQHNDARGAESAWAEWQTALASAYVVDPVVREAVTELQRKLFGPEDTSPWDGSKLAAALQAQQTRRPVRRDQCDLPPLNPIEVRSQDRLLGVARKE